MKTKPTQHSVKELRSIGIQPDILLCRAPMPIPPEEKRKIALFCNVRPEAVSSKRSTRSTSMKSRLPITREGLDREVLRHFGLEKQTTPDLKHWVQTSQTLRNPDGEVRIAIVGKYVALHDAYKSVVEALGHGGLANKVKGQPDLDSVGSL
jgi:CTP synthase